MRRRGVLLGASVLVLAFAACEPQTVRLFGNDLQSSLDAGGTPPGSDAEVPPPPPPPPPPPGVEQPACLSAACESCVADSADCLVGGVQWLCHPVTGECVLPCEPVSDSSQCLRGQSCHPGLRLCVDCVGSSDCGGATPDCDTARNECVECTREASCSAPTPACDTDAQRCVTCLEPRHCGGGLVCDVGNQRCVQCLVDEHCENAASGDDPLPRCDRERNVCVECLEDDDCRSDPDKPFCKLSELECDDDRD